ncbi:MAG: protein kinase [Acidobacteriota bacterium]
MIGKALGHYRITAAIGAGGMGEVYRATDTKLSRDVALKVLPAEMAADPDRLERFQREARALAALDHPGIVSVFSVEEADGVHFLTMQLVEGETLDAVIAEGGLPLARFLEIAVPLADAISAAHERGIVHRDLKPGNVMVTRDGRVKVLDFGLAKLGGHDSDANPDLSSSPTGSRANLTGEGQVFGTVAYMSPEQARGAAVDARSDVFSLGVVLYQMLTGERPFTGNTAVDMISSILRDKPPSVTALRADLPPDLARVLRRCLEKVPRDRYQTSRDVYNELRELRADTSSASAAPSPRAAERARPVSADSESGGGALRQDSGRTRAQAFWIAVPPFTHSGADPELESFAEGLAEDINAGLAKFPYLSVISRNATRRLVAQGADARAAGEQLAARYVVEGAIRKGASALRVNVQLVDTQTGAHLWAETFNRDLKDSDIFALQDGISGRVVATVADSYGILVRSMTAMIQQKADVDLSPSEWLFEYFAYRQQLSPPAHTAMKDRLERAVKRDAGQADLWACLAQVYTDEHAFGFTTDPTSLDRALAAARRAVELDRANQLGMVSLAQAYFFRQDLAAFRPAAEQAMALNRLNTDALGILGLLIVHTGEFQRGAAIVRRAMELNPNHAGWFHFGPIWEHFHGGEYDRALEHAMQVNMPGLFWQPLVIAAISGQLDRRAEAAGAVRDLLALDPGFAAHARRNIEVWHFASGLLEPILEGVRRGGLTVADSSSSPSITVSSSAPEAGMGARPSSQVIRARADVDEGFWVAVLPFKHRGTDPGLEALAEGLTEDIGTGLSRFSYLRVIARGSTSRYASDPVDVRTAGKELGARYVMEGNLRQAGPKLRLAVQLVDAVSGAHLWAESYERTFSTDAVFELQDELVPRIVSTVADMNGALPRSLSEAVRGLAPEELTPYEAVLRSFGYFQRVNAEELAAARSILEMAVRRAPEYSDAWAMLALLCAQEYGQGYSLLADSLAVGAVAARRAVEAGSSNHLAHSALAQVLFLQKELPAFRNAAARAVALNPMDGATVALVGILLAYAGDWENGCAITERAMRLNPHFPGWYRLAAIVNAYRTNDYRAAIDAALKIQMPGYFWTPVFCAAACGQLGEREGARKALEELLAIRPEFGSAARAEFSKWHEPELVEHFMDGLRKAGLVIPGEGDGPISASGAVRAGADEGFWVAVLPFHHGGDADLATLADGLTSDIVTGLSRFSYLHVIARSSTARRADADGPADARSAGKELGARYVMEGTLRQAGGKLRLAVQIVDATSGAHLWAESYERDFRPEALFELQDDLVPRIVSTVADMNGALPRSLSEAVRGRAPEDLSPYEAVLRSFGYFERITPDELSTARSGLESAVRKAPDHADAWAMLALLCVQDYAQGFGLQPDPLGSGAAAARRAVDAAPAHHLAWFGLAQALFFQKEFESFRNAAERAVALNPMDGNSMAFLGELLTYAGFEERGMALAGRAKQLNPNHPGWYWYADFYDAYRQGDDRGALRCALKVNMQAHLGAHFMRTAAYGQLGETKAAEKALGGLLTLKPDFPRVVRGMTANWWNPEYCERLVDGLRKAGLDVPA